MFEMGTGVTSLSYSPEGCGAIKIAPSKLHKKEGKDKSQKERDGNNQGVRLISDDKIQKTCGQVLDLLVPVG